MGRGCADVLPVPQERYRPRPRGKRQGRKKKKNAIAAERDMVPRSLLRQPNQAVGATDLGLANGQRRPASSLRVATGRRTNRFARLQHVEGQGGDMAYGVAKAEKKNGSICCMLRCDHLCYLVISICLPPFRDMNVKALEYLYVGTA
jgi:hypothetical protein